MNFLSLLRSFILPFEPITLLFNSEKKKGEKLKFNSINGDTKNQHWEKIWQDVGEADLFLVYTVFYFFVIYEFHTL